MPYTKKTLIYYDLLNEKESEKAWCFLFEKGGPLVYLPKSIVEDIRETANEVDIPLWLVDVKDLEEFVRR